MNEKERLFRISIFAAVIQTCVNQGKGNAEIVYQFAEDIRLISTMPESFLEVNRKQLDKDFDLAYRMSREIGKKLRLEGAQPN